MSLKRVAPEEERRHLRHLTDFEISEWQGTRFSMKPTMRWTMPKSVFLESHISYPFLGRDPSQIRMPHTSAQYAEQEAYNDENEPVSYLNTHQIPPTPKDCIFKETESRPVLEIPPHEVV